MSVCIAVIKDGVLGIAADTLFVLDSFKTKNSKLYLGNGFAIGWGGEDVFGQILKSHFKKFPDNVVLTGDDQFDLLQALYQEAIAMNLANPAGSNSNTPFGGLGVYTILASPKGAWFADGAFSITPITKFGGLGAGRDFGMGYLHGAYASGIGAEELARKAVECAIEYSTVCGAPVESASFSLEN